MRGAWTGLGLDHERSALLYATLEGVAFAVRDALDALPGSHNADHLRLAGGGSTGAAWRQMLADVLELPLHEVDVPAASGRGAALMGAAAVELVSADDIEGPLAPKARPVARTDRPCERVLRGPPGRVPSSHQGASAPRERRTIMTALKDATLRELSTRVAVPGYDRSAVTAGVVHFGVGAFHRAHEAMYLDTLMNNGQASDWGICGVGLLPVDRRMNEVLKAQDGLYTLVLKHPDGTWEPRVIGSVIEHLFAPDDPSAVLDRLCSPEIRVVSLTITEGGYGIHRVTGKFDPAIAGVTADLRPGSPPSTVFGFVAQALERRRQAGIPPFAVVSCDNVQGNGDVAREAFTSFADLVSPELARLGPGYRSFPELDGRPHNPCHDRQ